MKRSEHLFVVRMWREAGDGTEMPWRGSVEHVGASERRFFASLVELTEFLSNRLGGKEESSRRVR